MSPEESSRLGTQRTASEAHSGSPRTDDRGVLVVDWACVECKYNLRGLQRTGVCPECGVAIEESLVGQDRVLARRTIAQHRHGTYAYTSGLILISAGGCIAAALEAKSEPLFPISIAYALLFVGVMSVISAALVFLFSARAWPPGFEQGGPKQVDILPTIAVLLATVLGVTVIASVGVACIFLPHTVAIGLPWGVHPHMVRIAGAFDETNARRVRVLGRLILGCTLLAVGGIGWALDYSAWPLAIVCALACYLSVRLAMQLREPAAKLREWEQSLTPSPRA